MSPVSHKFLIDYSDYVTNDYDLFNIYWTNYEIDEYGNRIYLLNLPNKVSKDETEALVYGFITFITTHLEEMEK